MLKNTEVENCVGWFVYVWDVYFIQATAFS